MAAKIKTEKYRVLVDRRIGGKRCTTGDFVELGDDTASHLIASGVIEPVANTAPQQQPDYGQHQDQ